MPDRERRILFSGGGTVGHLAPGFALAEALEARGVRTLFATPGEAVERAWFEGRDAPHTLPALRLPRRPLAALRFPWAFREGVRAARTLFAAERIGALVALGGWPCAPAAWAAKGAGVPLAFLVPDAVPGLVVRKLRRRAQRIYLGDERARAGLGRHDGIRVTGPLLRAAATAPRRAPEVFGLAADRLTLFVTGGSLGAQGLYDRFLAGLAQALATDAGLAKRIQILHATGRAGADPAPLYEALGVRHHATPFIHDMGAAYGTADLVLCRAGANTCAELAATGTPAVLVPYPHHADRQQFKNAAPLVDAGLAVVVEEGALSPDAVVRDVLARVEQPETLATMRAAGKASISDAAGETADDLIRFLGWES